MIQHHGVSDHHIWGWVLSEVGCGARLFKCEWKWMWVGAMLGPPNRAGTQPFPSREGSRNVGPETGPTCFIAMAFSVLSSLGEGPRTGKPESQQDCGDMFAFSLFGKSGATLMSEF